MVAHKCQPFYNQGTRRRHHVDTTSAPRPHHVDTTFTPRLHHVHTAKVFTRRRHHVHTTSTRRPHGESFHNLKTFVVSSSCRRRVNVVLTSCLRRVDVARIK